jgi:hypothetical protein
VKSVGCDRNLQNGAPLMSILPSVVNTKTFAYKNRVRIRFLEAGVGFEPTNDSFAGCSLAD